MVNIICPKCKSKEYNHKKTDEGVLWRCKTCKFKKINKTAEQLLKEDPVSGRLKTEITKLQNKFEKQQEEKNEFCFK